MRFSQGASAAQAWCENSLLLKFVVLEKWIISQDRLGTDIRITQKHVRRFRRRSAGLFDALAQSDRVRSGCQRGIAGLCWECAGRTRQPQGCSRCDNTHGSTFLTENRSSNKTHSRQEKNEPDKRGVFPAQMAILCMILVLRRRKGTLLMVHLCVCVPGCATGAFPILRALPGGRVTPLHHLHLAGRLQLAGQQQRSVHGTRRTPRRLGLARLRCLRSSHRWMEVCESSYSDVCG